MYNKNEISPADKRARDKMFRLYQERGPQTAEQLVAAGFDKECQARNAAAVATRISLTEMA